MCTEVSEEACKMKRAGSSGTSAQIYWLHDITSQMKVICVVAAERISSLRDVFIFAVVPLVSTLCTAAD
jgi:hypothetical protein